MPIDRVHWSRDWIAGADLIGESPGSPAEATEVESGQTNSEFALTSLFGKKHVLFYMTGPQNGVDTFQTVKRVLELIDIDGDFARSYAASVLYLVRPDGYIAFRCLAAKHSLVYYSCLFAVDPSYR